MFELLEEKKHNENVQKKTHIVPMGKGKNADLSKKRKSKIKDAFYRQGYILCKLLWWLWRRGDSLLRKK